MTYHYDMYGFILKLTKQYIYIIVLDYYEFNDVDIRPNVNIKISTKEMKYIKRIELSEEYLNNMNFMVKHYIKSFTTYI